MQENDRKYREKAMQYNERLDKDNARIDADDARIAAEENLADLRKKVARVDVVDNVEQSYRALLEEKKKVKNKLAKLKSDLGPTSWHKKAKRHLSDGGQPTAAEQGRLGGQTEEEGEDAFEVHTAMTGNKPWM